MDKFFQEQYGVVLLEQFREHVNNLMAAIQLLTPVIREHGGPKYMQYLAIANQSIYRLMRLMSHMEFAQRAGEGDEEAIHRVPVDLSALCETLEQEISPLVEKAGCNFQYEAQTAHLPMQADITLLYQLILNLISYALHTAGTGGRVGLKLVKDRRRAILTIWSSGLGRVKREPERILGHGSTLSLEQSIACTIAELHGGTMVVEQQEDRESRAVVSLPIQVGVKIPLFMKTPKSDYDGTGGFSTVLVGLSDVLPYQIYLSEDLE